MSALSSNAGPATGATARGAGGKRRIREVDGYRAIAAVMIIVFHAWTVGYEPYVNTPFKTLMLGSQFAVSLFFALSGFVIFLPFVRGALAGKVPSGRTFLVRRLYRILPLYFLLVILVWASRFAGTPSDFWDLVRHLTFTQVYSKQQIFWLIGPAWSLADEMHYYVLVAVAGPAVTVLALRRASVRGRLLVMTTLPLVLLVASLTYTTIAAYGAHAPWSDSWVYFNPLARVDCFAEGMLLAVILSIPGAMVVRRKTALGLTLGGLAIISMLMVMRAQLPGIPVYYFAAAGVGSLLLLGGASMLDEDQRTSRFLRSRPFQAWAMIGFSLYLVHEPVMIQLARWHVLYFSDPVAWPLSTIGLIAAATIVAHVTYRLIEAPGLRAQKLLAELRSRQHRPAVRRRGPAPRWLPDLTLATAEGRPVVLRELPRDRPLLFALGQEGGRGLAEQRFRLIAGEADGFYVTTTDAERGPAGTTVLVDAADEFTTALNGRPGLIEVSPGGLITTAVGAASAAEPAVTR